MDNSERYDKIDEALGEVLALVHRKKTDISFVFELEGVLYQVQAKEQR